MSPLSPSTSSSVPPPRRSWGSSQREYSANSHLLETLMESSFSGGYESSNQTGIEVYNNSHDNNDEINESSSVISELTVEPLVTLQIAIDEVTSKMTPLEIKEELINLKIQTNEKDIALKSKMETLLDMKQKIDKDIDEIKVKQDNLKQMKSVVKEVERKLLDLQVEPKYGEVEI